MHYETKNTKNGNFDENPANLTQLSNPDQSQKLARNLNTSPDSSPGSFANAAAAPGLTGAAAKRIEIHASPDAKHPAHVTIYGRAENARFTSPVAYIRPGYSVRERSFDLYRCPTMQPPGARRFRVITLCKGDRADLERATQRALRVVAETLTGYGWTVWIVEPKPAAPEADPRPLCDCKRRFESACAPGRECEGGL